MTLAIDFSEEQTAALAAKAKAQGISTEQCARQVLEQDLAPEWLRQSWEIAKQSGVNELSMEEVDAEIAAARKNRRKPSLQPGARSGLFLIRTFLFPLSCSLLDLPHKFSIDHCWSDSA